MQKAQVMWEQSIIAYRELCVHSVGLKRVWISKANKCEVGKEERNTQVLNSHTRKKRQICCAVNALTLMPKVSDNLQSWS